MKIREVKEEIRPKLVKEKMSRTERLKMAFAKSFKNMIYAKMQEFDQFDKYVDESEQIHEQLEQQLQNRLKYIDLFREAHRDSVRHKLRKDGRFIYFEQCTADKELVLPILDYIHDNTLLLQSYTLSIGHCNAL